MIALHLHNNIISLFLCIIIDRLRLLYKSINYLLLTVVTPKNYVEPIFYYCDNIFGISYVRFLRCLHIQ